jgi:hypothetical protein
VLLGDDEPPLPNISVATMKYFAGSSAAVAADEKLVAERAPAVP